MIKNSFKGFVSGGYFYARSRAVSRNYSDGVRVRTFSTPESACVFVTGFIGMGKGTVVARDSELGDVPIVTKGQLEPEALTYLIHLLSDDELLLLKMFGVATTTLGRAA